MSHFTALSRLVFVWILMFVAFSSNAGGYVDSLVHIAQGKSGLDEKKQVQALVELSQLCWATKADSAISMSNLIIEIGERIGDEKIIGDGYFSLGMVGYVNAELENGYDHFISASSHYDAVKNTFEYCNSKYHAGICLRELNQYFEAISVLDESYQILITSNMDNLAFSVANEMGSLYSLIEDPDNSEKYFKSALKIAEVNGDTSALVLSYINLGCQYHDNSQHKKSLISFNSALKYTSPSDKNNLAQIHNHIGESYLFSNQLDLAENEFNIALLDAKEGDLKIAQSKSHFNLSKLYELKQQYALALIEYKMFSQINDSINAVIKTQTISQLQAKYDNASKDKELNLEKKNFEKQQEIDEREKYEQSLRQRYIIIGLALSVLFVLILFFAFRRQRKLNTKLDQLGIVAKEIDNTVIITDESGNVEWLNESYTKRSGLNVSQFKEKFGENIFDDPNNQKVKSKIEEAIKTKKSVEYYLTIESEKGVLNLKTSLTPKLNKEGEIEKFIIIDTDISELVDAEKKITSQRDKLQKVYNQLTESIDYAQRIQQAVLPHVEKLKNYFPDHFLYYNPKDVVSGDFYFVGESDQYVYVAGADCTGHGVPGALMSLICHNLLENAVQRYEETDDILKELNRQIIKKLRQEKDQDSQIKDSLDITLCRLSKTNKGGVKDVQISGAQNPLYIIEEGRIREIKTDRVHIGRSNVAELDFTKHNVEISVGSEIVLFSDGFPDQKGGVKGKKYYYQPFRELLIKCSELPFEKRSEFLAENFQNWKGEREQADDVFVLGLKI